MLMNDNIGVLVALQVLPVPGQNPLQMLRFIEPTLNVFVPVSYFM
jgi:hypothetical protein